MTQSSQLKQLRQEAGSGDSFAALCSAMRDAVLELDTNDAIVFANAAAVRLSGFSENELKQLPLPQLIPECNRRSIENLPDLQAVYAIGKSGKKIPVEITESRYVHNGNHRKLLVIRNLTERVNLENALAENQQQLIENEIEHSLLMEYAPVGIVILDLDGRFLNVNQSFCKIIQYHCAEISGKKITEFVLPKYRQLLQQQFFKLIRGDIDRFTGTIRLLNAKGSRVECKVNMGVIRINEKFPLRFVIEIEDITERQKREAELLLFREMVNNISDALYVIDPQTGNILDVNDRACTMLNYTRNELLKKSVMDIETVFTGELSWDDFSAVFIEQKLRVINSQHIKKDGSILPIEASITYVELNKKHYFIGIIRDTTERLREQQQLEESREKLRRSEEKLRLTLENAPIGIVTCNLDGKFQMVNQAFSAITGYSAGELENLAMCNLVHSDDRKKSRFHFDQLKELENTSIAFETRLMRKDNALIYAIIRANIILDMDRQPFQFVVQIEDYTRRKKTEEEFFKIHVQNEQLLDAITSVMIGIGPDGVLTHWNRAAEIQFGIRELECVGKRIDKMMLDWEWTRIIKSIQSVMKSGETEKLIDIAFKNTAGNDGYLNLTISSMTMNNFARSGILIIGEDTTHQKILEQQLNQAQKLESIGQLAAGIAHEINTPMQYTGDNIRFLKDSFEDLKVVLEKINPFIEAAKDNQLAPEMLQDMVFAIDNADLDFILSETPNALNESIEGVAHVSRIVRAMKEFSHPGQAEKSWADINKALESTITVAKNEWKYVSEVETDFQPDLPKVYCLVGEMNQVFLNMIINAAHAIAAIPKTGATGKGKITILTTSHANEIEVRISDSGTGIPENIRSKIFDPFFTTKAVGKGTGQGLAIAHNVVVVKHGGTISFESEMGSGTTFIIRLPLSPEEVSVAAN